MTNLNLTTYCHEPTAIARSWPNTKGQTSHLEIRRCNTSALLDNGDPHFWLDPGLAIDYVNQIRDGLAEVDPKHEFDYTASAETYVGQISALDQEIEKLLGRVANERRHLVTYHDAFGHLARRYNWEATALEVWPETSIPPRPAFS